VSKQSCSLTVSRQSNSAPAVDRLTSVTKYRDLAESFSG